MKKKERQKFLDQLKELRAKEHIKTAEPIAFIQEILGKQAEAFKEDFYNWIFQKDWGITTTKKVIQKMSEKTCGEKQRAENKQDI